MEKNERNALGILRMKKIQRVSGGFRCVMTCKRISQCRETWKFVRKP